MSRYLGNKTNLTHFIGEVIETQAKGAHSALDVFAGTGAVAKYFRKHGFVVKANDSLYPCYVQNKVLLEMSGPIRPELRERIAFLNSDGLMAKPPCSREEAFIYQNYSLHDDCQRMYFTPENALIIDYIRQWTEIWKSELTEFEYYYLLKLLIDAVNRVANTTGTYAAHLKYWSARSTPRLMLTPHEVPMYGPQGQAYCMDAHDFARHHHADLAYLDPPYCNRQYCDYYNVLETIARYDYPEIAGVTGKRVDSSKKSDFCIKRKAPEAFRALLNSLDVQYILLSYNNDKTSVLTTAQMTEIVRSCGKPDTFRFFETPYERYCGKNPSATTVNEQLYFIEK